MMNIKSVNDEKLTFVTGGSSDGSGKKGFSFSEFFSAISSLWGWIG